MSKGGGVREATPPLQRGIEAAEVRDVLCSPQCRRRFGQPVDVGEADLFRPCVGGEAQFHFERRHIAGGG